MPNNEINQSGTGNLAFTDIHNSEFNIFIGKSYQYNELLDQLKTQEKLLSLTPQDEAEERLVISKKINELNNHIEKFKQDVLQLAEQFNKTEINNDHLRHAKDFFDKGEFDEARTIYNANLSFNYVLVTPDGLRRITVNLLKGTKNDGQIEWSIMFVLSRRRKRESTFEEVISLLANIGHSHAAKAEKTAMHGLDQGQIRQAYFASEVAKQAQEDMKYKKRAIVQIEKIVITRASH